MCLSKSRFAYLDQLGSLSYNVPIPPGRTHALLYCQFLWSTTVCHQDHRCECTPGRLFLLMKREKHILPQICLRQQSGNYHHRWKRIHMVIGFAINCDTLLCPCHFHSTLYPGQMPLVAFSVSESALISTRTYGKSDRFGFCIILHCCSALIETMIHYKSSIFII